MDCRTFRKHHLAYLDDTLPGDAMSEAQMHIMHCDCCASHDTLVRRSLMLVRNLPTIEPSSAFSARLQERLAACRNRPAVAHDDDDAFMEGFTQPLEERRAVRVLRGRRAWLAMAAGVTVMGTVALRGNDGGATELELAPVMASAPAPQAPLPPMVSPDLVRAMSSGNPMWAMTLLLDDAPAHFLATTSTESEFASFTR